MLLRFASDDRLVEELRTGSEAAFEAIFARHHRGVLAFCRHMLGSVEEAEDAVQHTFLAAYRGLVRSDKPIQLRPWLYTIARNRCLSVLRASERAAGADVEPSTEHLSAVVERRQDLRDLLVDLARLPDDQRAALVLAEVGGMPHEEIAAVLSVRREKVKALVFQARTALIAGRTARDTPCAEIREQLANLTGGALLRRHLRDCAGCRQYRDEVRAQRRELALVLPVAPTLALKAGVLAGAGAAAAGAGAARGPRPRDRWRPRRSWRWRWPAEARRSWRPRCTSGTSLRGKGWRGRRWSRPRRAFRPRPPLRPRRRPLRRRPPVLRRTRRSGAARGRRAASWGRRPADVVGRRPKPQRRIASR